MARTVRNAKIDTRSARVKLAKRREPYWVVLTQGCAIGYRKGKNGGSWIARWRGPDGKQRYHALGPADDALDQEENGSAVSSYTKAQEDAREWFVECGGKNGSEPASGPYTVSDAITDYLADYQGRGGKSVKDARTRAEALILPALGAIELDKLTPAQIKNWRTALVEAPPRLRTRRGKEQQFRDINGDPEATRRRQSTANRTLAILKAALNYAWTENKVASADAWQRVKPFREVDAARAEYLSRDQITRLVNGCSPGFRPIVQGALLTGCRYGELAALRVADFNPDKGGTVHVRHSKAGKSRRVMLTDEGRDLFEAVTAGRQGSDLIFPRPDGKPWARTQQQRPLREACKRASIAPPANFHSLRHTYASLLVMADVPLVVVAKNLGHADTRMCERHYAHLAPSYVAESIRSQAPKLGIVEPGKVTQLKASRA